MTDIIPIELLPEESYLPLREILELGKKIEIAQRQYNTLELQIIRQREEDDKMLEKIKEYRNNAMNMNIRVLATLAKVKEENKEVFDAATDIYKDLDLIKIIKGIANE